MEKQLTAHLLRTLLSRHFQSKSDMARKLGVGHRAMQKAFQHIDDAKAGTIILDKALFYCAQHRISLDGIVNGFIQNPLEESGENMTGENQMPEAYNQLCVLLPDHLTSEGMEMFGSMLNFVRRASVHVCPACKTWCNPWDGEPHVEQSNCYIGHIIRVMMEDTRSLYTLGGDA